MNKIIMLVWLDIANKMKLLTGIIGTYLGVIKSCLQVEKLVFCAKVKTTDRKINLDT